MASGVERTQFVAFVLLIVLAVAVGNLIQSLGTGPRGGSGNSLPAAPGTPPAPFRFSPALVQGALLVSMVIGLGAVVSLLVMAARRGRRTRLLPSAFRSNVFLLALLAILLGVVALTFTRGRGGLNSIFGEQQEPQPLTPQTPTQPQTLLPLDFPLGLLLLVGAVGILLAVALLRAAEAKPRAVARGGPRQEVASEVARAAEALEGGGDFREAILRCYLNTCRLLSLRGAPADSALTAREFEAAARPLLGLSEGSLVRLTNLFEVVRYSPHPVGPRERDDAVACLRTIQGELGG